MRVVFAPLVACFFFVPFAFAQTPDPSTAAPGWDAVPLGGLERPFLPPGSRLEPFARRKGPTVTLQHDTGVASLILNVDADDVELVKFCPEGRGTIRSIQAYVDGRGLPASLEFHVWANFGNYNVDWSRDLSGQLNVVVTAAGWVDIPLPPGGVRFESPPCFWVAYHHAAIDPRLVTDPEDCLGTGTECVTSFIHAQTAGTYCLPNDQLGYLLLTDDCNGDGTAGDWADADYLVRAEFEYDDETTPVFTDVTDLSGLPRASMIAWGDADGDGDDDAYLGGALWRNDGNFVFTDVTAAAFAGGSGGGPGTWGDYDNDGDVDLFVFGMPDRLWQNQGDGSFVDVSASAGDIDDGYPTDAGGWADADRDGDLDYYKANYEDWNGGSPIYFPDVFLRNEGDGTFTDVTAAAGFYDEVPFGTPRAGRGVNWGDYDGDGWPDLHVSNYRLTPNSLFHGDGDGSFTNLGDDTGLQGTERVGPYAGAYGHTIGSQWADFDNDGDLDLLQGQLKHQWGRCFQDPTFLWRNEGGGAFTEVHSVAGIEYQEGHSDVSWGDVDNDGDLDFYITHVYACQPSQLYLNEAAGTSFRDVTWQSGLLTANGWGVAMSDVDSDGDLDVFTRGLFVNEGPAGSSIRFRLRGTWGNRSAIGARVLLENGGGLQLREVEGGKGTGTQSSLTQHFGLGVATVVERVTITWPSSCSPTVLNDLPADVLVELDEPCATLQRGLLPTDLTDFAPWDPLVGVTDAEVLPGNLRFYATGNEVLLLVAKDGVGAAVITGAARPRW